MTNKIFQTTVLEETLQSTLIMYVTGYSHFGPSQTTYNGSKIRKVYFIGHTNKVKLQAEIKEKLGHAFQPNLNFVQLV